MFLLVLLIFTLKLEPSISQFPQHMDLQKVGEVIFNNEKYNILKPTTHTITDYFKDFVLSRKKTKNIPTSRLFVDDNGFRHFWSGFDKKTKSLRKTEILADNFDNTKDNDDNNSTATISHTSNNKNENSNESNLEKSNRNYNSSNSNETISNNSNSNENTSNPSPVIENASERTNSGETEVTTPEADDIEVVTKNTEKNVGVKLRTHQKNKKVELKERNVVTTTFFCPFLGVITMSAFVD